MMKIYNALDGGAVVVGPLMLDRYIQCQVNRIDQASSAPVGSVTATTSHLGGAGNVVANLRALGVPTGVLSFVGSDDAGKEITSLLEGADVEQHVYTTDMSTTCVKSRLVDDKNNIFCRFDSDPASLKAEIIDATFIPVLDKMVVNKHPGVLVLSDYNKGIITPTIAHKSIKIANTLGMFSIVDPSPAHFSWYDGATMITPNLAEACEITGLPLDAEPFDVAKSVLDGVECENVLVTAGAEGMFLVSRKRAYKSRHYPAIGGPALDTTGAGDTVVAGVVSGIYEEKDIVDAVEFARNAAEVVVQKPGTAVVEPHEIFKLAGQSKSLAKITSIETAVKLSAAARKNDVKIAVTNGVFDLLHRGHLTLLEGAAKSADFLIVLVNSDAGARRVKSKEPIQSEKMRAEMLACYPQVDLVVVFSEDTPTEAIKKLKPHVLVKGADYTPDTVVGSKLVSSWGGVVKIIKGDKDSTSRIIKRVLSKRKTK